MTDKQKTGQIGEALAHTHLQAIGMEIVASGYRYKRVELDLIARKEDGCLKWGHPSGAVTPAKERNIARAASAYMREVDHQWEVRFDVVAILLHEDGSHILEHIEDAFFPGLF
jgi:putative endonuclease